jgi:hypothetical protein
VTYVSTTVVLNGYEGTFDAEDADQMAWLVDQITEAELLIERRVGDLTTWAAGDSTGLRGRALEQVIKRVVRRVLRNPEGYKAETDGDYSYQLDPRVASGSIWVTDEDWGLLGLGSRIRSIRLATGARCPQ